jgi:small subunit ribosomal protein S18
MQEVDYKEVPLLKRFTSSQAKIIDPMHTGVCASHQRRVAEAVKRARFLGLLPFVRQ